ncbi:glycosyltransferase family 4 protein [Sphingomonas morindae]|uniref:Glycosyltransferase n=1 Tax=Sphingomonas morindae TaxID=1541170 RepID=A0ABY4X658_9SPHN|nr:glycosyltransferase [Sphingomonas morindae]USI72354.1 glycosyltransferase [Sphingomonas morindae]
MHFVYYGHEGLTERQRTIMTNRWDYFYYVPLNQPKRLRGIDGYDIDDWCGIELEQAVRQLCTRWHFGLAITNYVWISRALTAVPSTTYRLIDTHDVFGERQRLLQAQGLAPTWFYCSAEEERRGLDRADAVIAIQDEEAEVLRTRTSRPVITIGHLVPANFLASRRGSGKIKVGYLASDNPSNRLSLAALIASLKRRPDVLGRVELLVGGRVSARVSHGQAGIQALGVVDEVQDFYSAVDLVLNPNVSGSGLKIKSVECLSFGRPLISTADGMGGIATDVPEHRCADTDEMVQALAQLTSFGDLAELANASRAVFNRYSEAQSRTFATILTRAAQRAIEAA